MVYRWRFEDPYDPDPATNAYTFVINPNVMEPLFPEKSITTATTTAVDGQVLLFQGNTPPVEWSFGGDILDSAHYEALRSWVYDRSNRLFLRDHYGRRITCVLRSFLPTPKRAVEKYWRHTYTIKAIVLDVSAPSVGLDA